MLTDMYMIHSGLNGGQTNACGTNLHIHASNPLLKEQL